MKTTCHGNQLLKRQGLGDTLFAHSSGFLLSYQDAKKKKRSGGKKLEIKPILPNGEQDTIPIPHTHTRCALDAMYNTVPFHLRRHQTNKREKKPSP